MNLILVIGIILFIMYSFGYLSTQENFGTRKHKLRQVYDIYEKSDYFDNPYEINNDRYGRYPVQYASHPHAYLYPLKDIH